MSVQIKKRKGNKITLEVTLTLDGRSMLQSEELIQQELNKAGLILSREALSRFDTDGSAIIVKGDKMTSKGKIKKKSKPPME